jgi:hypothetical protein
MKVAEGCRLEAVSQFAHAQCQMCVMVLQIDESPIGLALAPKKFAQPHHRKMPLVAISQNMAARSKKHPMPAAFLLKENVCVPSRTSRWYACQYHRTCRSSLYANVSCCDPTSSRRGRLTAGSGRLSGVNVADNDHVDVHLLFTTRGISKLFA